MDDRGMGYAGGALVASWTASLAVSLVLTEVAPNFTRTVPHWLAGSAVNGAIFYAFARSSTDSVSGRAVVLVTGPSLFAVFIIVPALSLVGWVVATMHPAPKIAAQLVLACVLWGVLASVFATATVIYLVLSDTVNGSAGLLINGTDSDRVVGSALLHDKSVLTTTAASGFLYPIVVCVNRRVILQFILLLVRTDNATDLAGLFMMVFFIMSSGPQFYVLTRYVESLTCPGREQRAPQRARPGRGILTQSIFYDWARPTHAPTVRTRTPTANYDAGSTPSPSYSAPQSQPSPPR